MVVPFISHTAVHPVLLWRHRISALLSPLKSVGCPMTAVANGVKVAVTFRACVIPTVHVLVPLHPSKLQPVKLESLAALAVNVTLVPWSKAVLVAIHILSQLSPAGLEVTVPLPVPAFTTVSVN